MKRFSFVVLAILAGLTSSAHVLATDQQAAASPMEDRIEQPVYSVGDQWTIQAPNGVTVLRVESIDPTGNITDNQGDVRNPAFNKVRTFGRGGTITFSPDNRYYDYPIYPGKSWNGYVNWTNSYGKRGSAPFEVAVKDWEIITISLETGEERRLRALRIERKGVLPGDNLPTTFTCWYLPEAATEVRCQGDGRDFNVVSWQRSGQSVQLTKKP